MTIRPRANRARLRTGSEQEDCRDLFVDQRQWLRWLRRSRAWAPRVRSSSTRSRICSTRTPTRPAKVGVKADKGGYTLDTQASGNYAAATNAKAAASGPVSRGYTEEIEHWAWCIRNPAPENKPRCYPEVAMADAIIALTTNVAMANGAKGQPGYIKFEESWFDRDSNDTPDDSNPVAELERMKGWKIV